MSDILAKVKAELDASDERHRVNLEQFNEDISDELCALDLGLGDLRALVARCEAAESRLAQEVEAAIRFTLHRCDNDRSEAEYAEAVAAWLASEARKRVRT